MAYTITNTDGSVLLLLADGAVDQNATSLALIGKNTNGFGQYLNNNLVRLLANSANTSGSPPRSPLKGQLWYDTTIRKLKVYDNGFKNVGGVTVATTFPVELASGDLWFDSANMQLKILNGSTLYTVGPIYPKSVGDNGWIVPSQNITDNSASAQQVSVLKNYGNTIALMSQVQFTPSTADNLTYFSTSTTQQVAAGLTVTGDINYSGKMKEKQLSTFVDVDILANTIANIGSDIGNPTYFGAQNNAIREILRNMFPPNLGTGVIDEVTQEFGVPYNSVCKVLVRYSQGGSNTNSGGIVGGEGYQIRRFKLNGQNGQWEYIGTTELNL